MSGADSPADEAGAAERAAPLVSIIVPTRNRADLLPEHLDSLRAAGEGVASEIIYVNDGSTDGTERLLAEWRPAVRSTSGAWGAPGPARNAGVALARGEYLLFTDDDCLYPPGWVRQLVERCRAQHATALTGGFVGWRMRTPAERYCHYRMTIIFGQEPKEVPAAPMMAFLIRRSVFEEVGGFARLRLTALEDWELCYRLRGAGYRIRYEPGIVLQHKYGASWGRAVARLIDTAWIAPLVWKAAGIHPLPKLARDTLRCLTAPFWCLRYFPLDLYAQAVALELLYYGVRLGSLATYPFTAQRRAQRHRLAGREAA